MKEKKNKNGEFCIRESCTNWTTHGSGVCETHRSYICFKCKKEFKRNKLVESTRVMCAVCSSRVRAKRIDEV